MIYIPQRSSRADYILAKSSIAIFHSSAEVKRCIHPSPNNVTLRSKSGGWWWIEHPSPHLLSMIKDCAGYVIFSNLHGYILVTLRCILIITTANICYKYQFANKKPRYVATIEIIPSIPSFFDKASCLCKM